MTLATSNTDRVLQKIKELPPLPLVVQKLIKVMDSDMSSAEDISRVLSSDQAMASKVLKLVNSSFYGLSGQVSTISRAVVILGVGAIRNLALGLSVAKIMSRGGQGAVQMAFWEHSLANAAAAETLARAKGYIDPEEAFVAGLLHDIGHLVFLLALPEEFTAIMQGDHNHILEREKEITGLTHAQAGQKLLKHWKLPRNLEQAIRFHHNGPVITGGDDPLASAVAMADALAGVHGNRYEAALDDQDFLKLVQVTGLDVQEVNSILATVNNRIEETRLFLQIATDDELVTSGTSTEDQLEIVLICTDKIKTAWTQQILEFMGHEIVPMKQFFAHASNGEIPDLVILDPGSVSAEQLAKMKPVLDLSLDVLAIFGKDEDGRVRKVVGIDPPRLPLGFSRQDLVLHPAS
jgi:putative nucleotidyltransferase with HDIG domain